ncbi:hypothetical protein FH972_024173 [Carpinus fangiana]|uniref:Uncharacterized protein n=1 Tax=Carpinus fangiana TaxID=176857 RepID=A0A5N6KXP3_9ROSI|nr:hypothetical protein FH972_024173 [Carpinus fangiana]
MSRSRLAARWLLSHPSSAVSDFNRHQCIVNSIAMQKGGGERRIGCRDLFRQFWTVLSCRRKHATSSSHPARSEEVFPDFPPWPPQQVLADRISYMTHIRARTSDIPKGHEEDSPLYSLYRLYERLVLDDTVGYRNEIEYFWRHRDWPVCEIPDPRDPNAARYAFLAGIPQLLVRAFNNNIGIGLARYTPAIISPEEAEALRNTSEADKKYESAPHWTHHVPRLDEALEILMVEGPNLVKPKSEELDLTFEKLNIRLAAPHISFT